MTIFYDVDPSDVRKQRKDFRSSFEKTCQGKTEEEKQRWSKALTDVADIEGEHSLNWDDEVKMIQKIVEDVSNRLNVTPSRDFEGMVGMEVHLRKLNSLLYLECNEVKMIGIWGPAGIGKSTIARALYNQLSSSFRFICFMGNFKEIYKIKMGVDDYDSKLCLQSQFLSKILNQRDLRVRDLGAIKKWLHDKRVLIILDDVDDLKQLETLANKPCWFGPGSRIIITTKDKKILRAHWFSDIYPVDFPSKEEALEILCLSAFKQSSPHEGFEELANNAVEFCGNLPLGLCVVGSSLRGESKDEWELQLYSLDRKIENILRVGYDKLLEKDQYLFLHIACFFNNDDVDHMTLLLTNSNLNVRNGLKTLADKCLVHISTNGCIVMHCLLEQLGRQIVLEQSHEPGRRRFLVEAQEIRDVLTNESGTGSVIGISFDMSTINEFSISRRAFEGMRNLQFLRFYTSKRGFNQKVTLLEDMEYLPRLSLLDWNSYPGKRLPPTFWPEYIVEIKMQFSELEELWRGIQPLVNLKKIDLSYSLKLIAIPNLSKASSLEILRLVFCKSLVELPSSVLNLHKLKKLTMKGCEKLQIIPTNINLASLEDVDMSNCSQLNVFPDISRNITHLDVRNTEIKEVHPSIDMHWSHLTWLHIGSKNLSGLSYVPKSIMKLDLRNSDIETIPDCVIGLPLLQSLIIQNCRKLVSLQGLPPSLWCLDATDCRSLKTVLHSFSNPCASLNYRNCVKLDGEARIRIIHQWCYNYVCLPGTEIPMDFTHKNTGNSITIPIGLDGKGSLSESSRFKACLLLSPVEGFPLFDVTCRLRSKEGLLLNEVEYWISGLSPQFLTEHLLIFCGDLFQTDKWHELDVSTNEILFEFSCRENDDKIIECGVQLREEGESSNSSSEVECYEIGDNSNHHTYGDYERMVSNSMTEEENQNSPPLTLESLAKSLRSTTRIALEKKTDARFDASEKLTAARLEALESRMDEKFELMLSYLKRIAPDQTEPIQLPQSTNCQGRHENQVRSSALEPCRSPRHLDVEELGTGLVESQQNLVKRVEMPIFQGQNSYGWISKVERYFRLGGYSDAAKLKLVAVSLDEGPLSWFNGELMRKPFTSWEEFKRRLIARYSKDKFRDISQPLYAIKQTGTVEAYVQLFEELSSQVSGFPETQLEGIFMNGLTPEMQEVVTMCKPIDLPDMISWALKMETSSLYSVVSRDMQYKRQHDPFQKQFKSVSELSSQVGWKMKTVNTEVQSAGVKPQSKPTSREQQRLSREEIAERRRLGLCFKCPEKWSRSHLVNGECPNQTLQVLTVINGLEMEVLDGRREDGEDGDIDFGGEFMGLSLSSFLGSSSPTTTKLLGILKKQRVVVLLDSGATHNFISPALVTQAHLKTVQNTNLEVLLGTGVAVKGSGLCKNVSFLLQGVSFSADFIALELGNGDMILGIQWLRTLGKCHVDWASHELSFTYQNQWVTLRGDPSLHVPDPLFKSLCAEDNMISNCSLYRTK